MVTRAPIVFMRATLYAVDGSPLVAKLTESLHGQHVATGQDGRDRVMVGSPARAIDAILGAVEIACRCVHPHADRSSLPYTVAARLEHLRTRDGPTDPKSVARWRAWCGLHGTGDPNDDVDTKTMMATLDDWVDRIGLYEVFA